MPTKRFLATPTITLSKLEMKSTGIFSLVLTAIALVVFTQNYVKYASTVEYFSVPLSLLYNLIVFSTYAFFTPLIIKAVARFPLGSENYIRHLFIHFVFSIGLGLSHMLFCNLVLYGIELSSSPIFPRFITKYLTNVIHFHLLAYWIILALVSKKVRQKTNTPKWIDRFVIKENKYTSFLELDQVYWIEALDHYQKLHTESGFFIYKDSMSNLVEQLPSEKFRRVHRSSIVNLKRVEGLQKSENQLALTLANGQEVSVGKSFKTEVRSLFS